MHSSVQNLINIQQKIKQRLVDLESEKKPKIIAVSKTFGIDKISPLIEHGHLDFGENKVQEANEKWTKIKQENNNIKLHLIGSLQTNKVKVALKLFDYIHSLDSKKLADKIFKFQKELNSKNKFFIQVNIGNEDQKSGVPKKELIDFYNYCKKLDLDIIGLMCIPPFNEDSKKYFEEMDNLNKNLKLNELSMGMSGDYLDAIENNSTFVRIGSNIFGQRN